MYLVDEVEDEEVDVLKSHEPDAGGVPTPERQRERESEAEAESEAESESR
jgi:hypothetical protein